MKEKNIRELSGAWTRHSGDFWGGFAAMLVALPASVAFGVTVYAAIDPHYAAFGALAGVLGAMALGLIAPTFGGTDRLISAPCAPAAAVLSAFAIELVHQGVSPASIVLMLTVVGILAGVIQILIGFLGVGRLIRYIPYPVVSGFLSGVGLTIIGGQLPELVGAKGDAPWHQVLFSPEHWDWRGLTIGGVTIVAMLFSSRVFKKIPAAIVGVVCGALSYAAIAIIDPSLQQL
ncbi:MAG: cyclic nucleotide-binding protein, partial [Candidatus Accumulibacter sp.]|nr:cyclic nucleotide-binding protein [Accumulibacter sp.]